MKKNKLKNVFFEELRKIPIVQVAAEKSGLSRNSVYRWRKEDPVFLKQMDEAMVDGVAFVSDMTESQLLNLISDNEFSAISFWLRHRHPAYKAKVEVTASVNTINELSPEQESLVKEALAMAGITEENESA